MQKMQPFSKLLTLIALAVLALPTLGGCQTGRGTSSVTPSYVTHYRAGDYGKAYQAAKAFPTTHHGSERLIAGMALAAQGNDREAKTWLQPLMHASDREIRGRAQATMGLILAKERSHQEAAQHLNNASNDLSGPLKRWAAHYGAEQYAKAGDNLRAGRMRSVANLRGPVTGASSPAGDFTVQLGSFSSRSRAQSRVRDAAPAAVSAGYEKPRVEMTMSGSRPLYAVRVGQFQSPEAAKAASTKFPGDTAVIRMN
ncbi:MAG: hypothetical protein Phyf2KO_03940 [Phycisphaerales bacterium]